jgi:oligopeptide transport system permease protein
MIFNPFKKDDGMISALAQVPVTPVQGRSPWQDARARFLRNKAAMVSVVLLSLIVAACLFGPLLLPHAYDSTDWNAMSQPPSYKNWHLFGTDESGRDLLVRCLVGGRISLMVGLLGTLSTATLGILWGATAGFIGGRTDSAMMRIVDLMYAIPYILIAILLITILGREFYLVVLVITTFSWMSMARIVRGQTLSLRSREYVEAARAIGVSTRAIILRHIIPNLLSVVVIYTTIMIPSIVIMESILSFLGLGIQEPMTSWGVLIHDGAKVMETSPWILIFPAIMMSITLYSLNFIGDGLRDALDPKER